jgi:tetratricopeptide (TPR) repeat protein/serine/threonine protein kinase
MTDPSKELSEREEQFGEIAFAYLRAKEEGRHPDPQEWLARYPEFALELGSFLADQDEVDRLAAPLRAIQAVVLGPAAPPEMPVSGVLGDFRIVREVGRGGMGVVYEAEQVSLARRVALKVLPFAATMDPRHLQRFHNEARAAASLEHPHIVPVYGVGCERGVHYYAMKFIDGQSLAGLLQGQHKDSASGGRQPPDGTGDQGADAPRSPISETAPAVRTEQVPRDAAAFRRIAEWGIQAAEALEHAHSLGIVHRDIKPANLMIDGQGALSVTDFGLARTAANAGLTMTGDVLGTLRYMSPEQALAKHGLMDHRTDVYSLGVTLYELLTGTPAVNGKDREQILNAITLDEPRPPRELVPHIPRDLETILFKAIAKNPGERYLTAQALADDLGRWLQDRPIQARRPTLVQRARKFARRHRAAVTAATVCLLVTLAVVVGSVGWVLGDRATQQREAESKVVEALEAAEPGLQQGNPWDPLLTSAVQRAEAQLNSGTVGLDLRRRVEQLQKDVQMLVRLETARLQSAAGSKATGFDDAGEDRLFAGAFAWYGLDVIALSPQEAAQRLRASAIGRHLIAALDYWAFIRNKLIQGGGASLRAVADLADDDPWQRRLRRAVRRRDRGEMERLAQDEATFNQPPTYLVLLANYLNVEGSGAAAERLLRRAQAKHPADFWINFALENILYLKKPSDPAERVRFLQAALALRPQSPAVYSNLGGALYDQGKLAEAEAASRKAIELQPDYAFAYGNLGDALGAQGKLAQAVVAYQKTIELRPKEAPAFAGLGNTLVEQGKLPAGEAACRKAIELKPDCAIAHWSLAKALYLQRKFAAAEAESLKAIRYQPDLADAFSLLGAALRAQGKRVDAVAACEKAIALKPDFAEAYCNLSNSLRELGKPAEAEAACRKAIELKPGYAEAHCNLGCALGNQRKFAEAISAFQQAIALRPNYAEAHDNLSHAHCDLGIALEEQWKLKEAVVAFQKAIEIKFAYAEAHYSLGNALRKQRKPKEAEAAYRRAIAVKRYYAEAHCNLGLALLEQGRIADSLAALRRGHELGSRRRGWAYRSAEWVRSVEKLVTLEGKLPALLNGESRPADTDETLAVARLCYFQKRYQAAARFYARGFAASPALANDLNKQHRYDAACSAARAACLKGEGAASLDERARLRKQALDWLRADLAVYARLTDEGNAQNRTAVQHRLRRWQQDPDFASVRGTQTLARLPKDERLAWQKLWADVAATQDRAGGNTAPAQKSERK